MYNYETVTAAIKGLKERGYDLDFNIAFDKLICVDNDACLVPGQFEITEIHRFEGDTNPSDEDIVYGIKSKDGKIKGVFSSAYGIYADEVSAEMLQELSIHLNEK